MDNKLLIFKFCDKKTLKKLFENEKLKEYIVKYNNITFVDIRIINNDTIHIKKMNNWFSYEKDFQWLNDNIHKLFINNFYVNIANHVYNELNGNFVLNTILETSVIFGILLFR